ncbi:Hypothetical protein LUCI_2800 [Lucifera butyrica]|uniref:DUF2292 domain-containing protein n=1 Tax=Lucifera butyrica TaxID=1351585 RepID=A0A498R4C0_9FIRM|nr:YezD family protein [Lucifera butyrica]VBB07536.1 Hypothetical protein LUCI_2800 [Lucifera butyrica]
MQSIAAVEPEVLSRIEQAANQISYGTITVIVQDSRVIQVEFNEKIRVADIKKIKKLTGQQRGIREKAMELVQDLQYGQIVIIIQEYRIVRVERTEKFKIGDLEGLYGDGI